MPAAANKSLSILEEIEEEMLIMRQSIFSLRNLPRLNSFNPSNAKANCIQSTRMQKKLKLLGKEEL